MSINDTGVDLFALWTFNCPYVGCLCVSTGSPFVFGGKVFWPVKGDVGLQQQRQVGHVNSLGLQQLQCHSLSLACTQWVQQSISSDTLYCSAVNWTRCWNSVVSVIWHLLQYQRTDSVSPHDIISEPGQLLCHGVYYIYDNNADQIDIHVLNIWETEDMLSFSVRG